MEQWQGGGEAPATFQPQPLKWTMECQASFEKLKCLFAAELVLKHPDSEKPFIIQVNASDVEVGALLFQKNLKGELQPCAYTSYKLLKQKDAGLSGRKKHMQSSRPSSPGGNS